MNLTQVLMRLNAKGYETFQGARKSFMNQIRDIIRKLDEGIDFDEVEDKKEKKEFSSKYSDNKLRSIARRLVEEGKMQPEEGEYLNNIFDDILPLVKPLEKEYMKNMKKLIRNEAIYLEFLDKIRGIDKVLSAQLVAKLGDCSRFDTVSKLWQYCGQGVVNGKAPQRRKGKPIKYNPKLKSLTYIVSDCLMKANKGVYRDIYDKEKERQLSIIHDVGSIEKKYGKPYKKEDIAISRGHAHNRALRKSRKVFLDHYWHASRELAGLPAKKNYVEGVLKHEHIISWREAIELEIKKE